MSNFRPLKTRISLPFEFGAVILMTIALEAYATPPVYRAIVLETSLGPRAIESNSPFTLAYWPRLGVAGEGLRFRIILGDTIIGTVLSDGQSGLAGCRAMRWGPRSGTSPGGSTPLPLLNSAIGSIATDANDAGTVVGALLFDSNDKPTVAASAWQPTATAEAGGSTPTELFAASDQWCAGQAVDSMALAVGAADSSSVHNALVTGALAAVHHGLWARSFGVRVGTAGIPGTPFDDQLSADWCSAWSTVGPQISSFSEAVIPPTDGAISAWQACYALGSRRQTVTGPTNLCVWTQYWDSFAWNQSGDLDVVQHCAACDGWNPNDVPCVRIVGAELVSVSDVRLASVAVGNASAGRSSAFAGIIEERRAPIFDPCSSNNCADAHAAVVLDPLAPESARRLFDLHKHVQIGGGFGRSQSGIAKIIAVAAPQSSLPATWRWIGVGAAGTDFRDPAGELHGCIWIGREQANPSTEWCAFDADEITIRPPGITIEAIHDITQTGVAVGIARDTREGAAGSEQMVLLTEPSDLNGDLRVNGADLGALLGLWGPVSPTGSLNADMNGDGVVDGADLGIFLGNWNWIGTGSGSMIRLDCQADEWSVSNPIPISVEMAANALGFASLNELGQFARVLPVSTQVQLCETVTVLAIALEENN